jgi:RNA polymerase-binding transcription factor DksA
MDAAKIGHFTKVLRDERVRVESELSSLGIKDPNNPAQWDTTGGDIDTTATESDELADRQEEYEERGEELDALKNRYTDIQDALKKIDDGTYGICEENGEPIEMDRLEANPAARTCKAHMGKEE